MGSYINVQCEKMRRARTNWSDVVLLALLRVVLPVAVYVVDSQRYRVISCHLIELI